jgi:putative membrane protein
MISIHVRKVLSMSDLNDPRVFFAAERTLLAWNRTALAWLAFGFVVERFGLFLRVVTGTPLRDLEREATFWLGMAFIFVGALIAVLSTVQYRKVLKSLKPVEIPDGYRVGVGIFGNLALALLGMGLLAFLAYARL